MQFSVISRWLDSLMFGYVWVLLLCRETKMSQQFGAFWFHTTCRCRHFYAIMLCRGRWKSQLAGSISRAALCFPGQLLLRGLAADTWQPSASLRWNRWNLIAVESVESVDPIYSWTWRCTEWQSLQSQKTDWESNSSKIRLCMKCYGPMMRGHSHGLDLWILICGFVKLAGSAIWRFLNEKRAVHGSAAWHPAILIWDSKVHKLLRLARLIAGPCTQTILTARSLVLKPLRTRLAQTTPRPLDHVDHVDHVDST